MCQTGFGILVEGLRGGTVSPASNINFFFSLTDGERPLKYFFFLKKIEGSLRSLLLCPNKQMQSTQIPPPTLQPWAGSGHARCK